VFTKDLRHIALIDFRSSEEFDQCFIRDSINFDSQNKNSWLGLVEYLKRKHSTALETEKKFELKKIRRILFVPQSHAAEEIQREFEMLIQVCETNEVDLDKAYYLKESVGVFSMKFGFLCLNKQISEQVKKEKEGNNLDKEATKKLMYSHSRFPVVLIETQLLLGTTFNMNSNQQLADMGVKSLVRFDIVHCAKGEESEEPTKLERTTWGELDYLRITINTQKFIEFDHIIEQVRELPTPRLMCCQNSMKIAANFAIAYLMNVQKVDSNKATLEVCSRIGMTDLDKMIYSQVMMYKTSDNGKFIKL